MIYVDQLFVANNKLWCHMITDGTKKELHAFAQLIGVKKCWYHKDHYDLKTEQREMAVKMGAVETTTRELVKIRAITKKEK